jgi:hypothetical protein
MRAAASISSNSKNAHRLTRISAGDGLSRSSSVTALLKTPRVSPARQGGDQRSGYVRPPDPGLTGGAEGTGRTRSQRVLIRFPTVGLFRRCRGEEALAGHRFLQNLRSGGEFFFCVGEEYALRYHQRRPA